MIFAVDHLKVNVTTKKMVTEKNPMVTKLITEPNLIMVTKMITETNLKESYKVQVKKEML